MAPKKRGLTRRDLFKHAGLVGAGAAVGFDPHPKVNTAASAITSRRMRASGESGRTRGAVPRTTAPVSLFPSHPPTPRAHL